MSAAPQGSAIARCCCGGVEFVAVFPSRFCAHCYCESCRRAHGASPVTWIGFPKSQVRMTRGAELVRSYESSPGTRRTYCGDCGTRLAFESSREGWSEETHLPLALFVTPVDRAPHVNSFADERAEWAPFHAF